MRLARLQGNAPYFSGFAASSGCGAVTFRRIFSRFCAATNREKLSDQIREGKRADQEQHAVRLPVVHHFVHCLGAKSGCIPAPLLGSSVQHATFGGLLSRHRQHAPCPSRGLCYDKHHVRAVTVAVAMPDTLPCVLKGRSGTGGHGKPRQSLVYLSVH